jgi:hypothetical protein
MARWPQNHLIFIRIHPSQNRDQGKTINVIRLLALLLVMNMVQPNDQLAPVTTANFDMPFIGKTVVGRYWEIFNNEQKSKFVETFSKLSIAT